MIKIIICGTRTFCDFEIFSNAVDEYLKDFDKSKICIISGGARGADELAKNYAKHNNFTFIEYPANWKKYGRKAGLIRNCEMLAVGDACLGFHDGESRGTAHMLTISRKKGIPTQVYYYKNQILTL